MFIAWYIFEDIESRAFRVRHQTEYASVRRTNAGDAMLRTIVGICWVTVSIKILEDDLSFCQEVQELSFIVEFHRSFTMRNRYNKSITDIKSIEKWRENGGDFLTDEISDMTSVGVMGQCHVGCLLKI